MGRDQSLRKLREECDELNTKMHRAKIILGLERKQGGLRDGDKDRAE